MAVPPRLRYAILERDQFRCNYCKQTEVQLEVDHVIPKSLGGSDLPENLVAACKDCNIGKSSAPPGTFLNLPRPRIISDDDTKTLSREAARWRRRLRDEEYTCQQLKKSLEAALKRITELVVDVNGGNSSRIWLLFKLDDLLDETGKLDEKKIASDVAPATTDPEAVIEQLIRISVADASESSDSLSDACQKVMAAHGYDERSISRAVQKLP